MFKNLHVWAIEVDKNQQQSNLNAQRCFIREFGRAVFASIGQPSSPLRALRFPYFTRIFSRQRDKMGAYVRFHFFVDDEESASVDSVTAELDRMLERQPQKGLVFQVKKNIKDGIEEAKKKGAENYPEQYYSFVHNLSRIAVTLFEKDVADKEVESIVCTWSHNVFNLLLGYDPR